MELYTVCLLPSFTIPNCKTNGQSNHTSSMITNGQSNHTSSMITIPKTYF